MSDTEDEYGTQSEYSSEEEETEETREEEKRQEALRVEKVKQDKIDRAKRIADNDAKQLARLTAEKEARAKKLELARLPEPVEEPVEEEFTDYPEIEEYDSDESDEDEEMKKEARAIKNAKRLIDPKLRAYLAPLVKKIEINEDGGIVDDRIRRLNQEQIERTYREGQIRQKRADIKDKEGLERVKLLFDNGDMGKGINFTPDNRGFTMRAEDATPEFLASIQDALETPESKAQEEQAIKDEIERKRIKKVFYASTDVDNMPDFPWTDAQAERWLPEKGRKGKGDYSKESERNRDAQDKEFARRYGGYVEGGGKEDMIEFLFESSSEDELEDVPEAVRTGILHEQGNIFYTKHEGDLLMTEPLPWSNQETKQAFYMFLDRAVAQNYTNLEEPQQEEYLDYLDKIRGRKAREEKKLEIARLPEPVEEPVSAEQQGEEESDGLITDDEEELEDVPFTKSTPVPIVAPAVRPDLASTATMGQGKKGNRLQEIIFPKLPQTAYEFTTKGKSYGEATKSFLEQQRDAMLKLKTKEGKQFTSMFPKDSAGNVIDGERDPNAQVPKLGLNIMPWLIEEEEAKAKEKSENRKQTNIEQRQKDYDEDTETYLKDKKQFVRNVKAKRKQEEKDERNYTNSPAFIKSFNLRRKKPVKKKPSPKARSPSPEPPPKPPRRAKVKARTPSPVAPPRKRRGLKKKSPPPKRPPPPTKPPPRRPPPKRPAPTRPRPKTPDPKPAPKPAPKPRPASISKSKRATRSDKGQHHKWSDGRENSATYKKNKAKGVDWSAVRCRASTCWEIGDRSKDAKGKGAFKKNESSGEYKKQLREKKAKKKKKKSESSDSEEEWAF